VLAIVRRELESEDTQLRAAVMAHVRQSVEDKLRVANPKYLEIGNHRF
jgi:hypothetical protein